MKIIFLDIDGVLNSEKFYEKRHRCYEKGIPFAVNWPFSDIDPDSVDILNKVIKATNARIVMSSTWRLGETVDTLTNILHTVGVKGKLVGKTKSFVDDETTKKYIKQELDLKWAGRKVTKKSNKPFKFGFRVGAVDEVVLSSPYKQDVIAFKIKEDGTFVEAWRCEDVETNEAGPRNLSELSFHDRKLRGIEIKDWLTNTTEKVESYAIIDDDDDMLESQADRFVHTDHVVGITEQDAEKLTQILNRK